MMVSESFTSVTFVASSIGEPAFAFRLVKQRYPKAIPNLLRALAAGFDGKDWRHLTAKVKDRLRVKVEKQ